MGRSFQNSTDDEERCKLELEVERLKAEVKSLKGDVKGLTTEREQIMVLPSDLPSAPTASKKISTSN